jgi:hypothetical protein
MKKLYTILLIIVLMTVTTTKAQSLEETLSNLSSGAGKAYVAPVISAFGSNLNSGWVSRVPEATKFKLHLDLKLILAGSFFSDEHKTFNATGKFFFSSQQVSQILQASGYTPTTPGYNQLRDQMLAKEFEVNFAGPTIVGSKNRNLKITFPQQTISASGQNYTVNSYTLNIDEVKGLLDELTALPTPGVQLTGGTVFGTNVSIRYSPKIKVSDELGDFSLWGIGAIHNPGAFLAVPLPVDIAISYFSQKMTVGDVFESTAGQFGIFAGKSFGGAFGISPYVGYIIESSKTKVSYDYQSNQTVNGIPVPKLKVNFESEGENKSGFVVGLTLRLGIININADYKAAKTSTASAGVSLGF